MLRGDSARLSQVIANLLNNAAKYTEEGGVIDVSLAATSSGKAEIVVTDNGIGIEAGSAAQCLRAVRTGQALARPQPGRPRSRV